jgi:outer membrane lipoprotein LolB
MKKWTIYLQLLALSLFTVGCSNVSQKPSAEKPTNKQAAWEQRQVKFTQAKEWRLQGKVAINHQEQNWPFSLSWLQRQGENYEMNIKHPLTGAVLAYLKSDSQGVMLRGQDGKEYRDSNAENLLKSQLGVGLPLQGMRYWVRGLSAPSYEKATVTLDDYGRPITLVQAGWSVQYPIYQDQGQRALPEKVILTHGTNKTRIKVIAKNWKMRY